MQSASSTTREFAFGGGKGGRPPVAVAIEIVTEMDKSWIDLPNRMSREYMDGINQFMEFTNGFDNEFMSCPCRKCANRYYYRREFVQEHLILNGFLKQYKNWIRHGEEYVSCRREERDEIEVDDMSEADPMIAMLNDIACSLAPEYTSCETEGAGGSNPGSNADEEALRYFEILDDAQTKLYHRSKDFSKLSFIVELLHLKALNQWYDTSFDMLLQLLHRVLPSGAKLAESYYQARKLRDGRRMGLVTIVKIVLQVLSIVANVWQQSK
ncbi:hypothetical protein MRB53_035120 [Persea americana]|uniref:Uncharacterized protein n=1 Tax=Persea americana TaxID=3435 RepID=A0ACC2K4C4_PERAE|nr:hypothetical protein MRB53_035120 [Persea americana]